MSRPKGSKNKKVKSVKNNGVIERNDGELTTPEKIKEIFIEKEVIRNIPEVRLEGWQLYKSLKDKGYYQGGMGQWMEDPNGTEKVYIPHVSEVYTYFIGNPAQWELMRDALIRAYIELQQ